jgi:hypothetical protein
VGIYDEKEDFDEIAKQEDGKDEIEHPPTLPAGDIVSLMEDDDSDKEVET